MNNKITCPYCNKSFEPTDAYKHELEEKLLKEVQLKHQQEVAQLKREKQELTQSKEKEIEEAKRKTAETVRQDIEVKIRKELETKIATTQEEAQAREKQNKELQDQLKDMLRQMRELKNEKDKLSIEYEKKLLEGQDKIKQAGKKEAQDELSLRIAEKDKKLQDAEKQIIVLQRKIQQGSQQLQGEVQELKLEELLREEFLFDDIKEVPKGVSGADALQVVRTQTGVVCGTILWESKRTKNWSPSWIQKLKEDQRAVKADLVVLVSRALPQNIQSFGMVNSTFVSDLQSAMGVAHILRQQLIKVHSAYVANSDRVSKADVVYNYLISNEFKQRIEVWVEFFRDRQEKINKERSYFNKKWQEEEKSIHKVMASTAAIYGDLQGLIGNALPKIRYLELPESVEDAGDENT